MRRKGERPVRRAVRDFSPDMAVADAIRGGDPWFRAWNAQEATGGERLRKKTGISAERLRQIAEDGVITRAELEALAKAWWITPEGLLASTALATDIGSPECQMALPSKAAGR